MLICFFSLSFAVPSYLGPDGRSYIGLHHDSHRSESVVVDPRSGELWIEAKSGHIWKGDHWEGANPQDPKYGFVQSRLVTVSESDGKSMYVYDSEGKIVWIRHTNGKTVRIHYQKEGKVSRIEGGSGEFWSLTWGKALVVVQEGRPTIRLSYEEKGNAYTLTAIESTGRTVQSAYKEDVLQYWIDPLGSRTDLLWDSHHLTIKKDDGRVWSVGFDAERNLTALTQPDTSAWVWKRSSTGALQTQIDPLGREIHFETNEDGLITSSSGLTTLSYHRDARGHLTKVEDAIGLRFRLVWDGQNRITTIKDATDGKILFSYDSKGAIQSITDRSGSSWFLERDNFGLLTRIITPDQSVWSISRDTKGHPNQLKTPFSLLDIARDYQSRVSVLTLNNSDEIAFVRDRSGNVISLRYRDQIVQKWTWNHVREPISLWTQQGEQRFSRDAAGWISSWADFLCSRDSLGRVLSMEWNGRKYDFLRDAIGRIQKIQKSLYDIRIQYDRNDFPLVWKESNGASSSVTRNERGQIMQGDEVHMSYDVRGWIQTVQLADRTWRWSRDIAGRVLQMVAPAGAKIGFDRAAYGLISFIRYPNSTIQRFFRSLDQLETRLIASDSTLLEQVWYIWNQYGLLVEKKKGDTRTFFRRDPNVEVVAVERGDGLIWSKTLDGIHDGLNGKAIFAFDGRVIGIQPPLGSFPYGQELGYLAYNRDEEGKITELIDAREQAKFSYDKLERLRSICFRSVGCWKFFYDPRGVLSGFSSPKIGKQKIYWRPDMGEGEFSHPVLLAVGEQSWLDGPNGLIVSEKENSVSSFVYEPTGMLSWILNEKKEQPYPSLSFTYMGEVAPIFGHGNLLHLGAAGPVFQGDIAFEPFSGQRYDGISQKKYEFTKPYHRLPSLQLDALRSFWRDPLEVLAHLSLLPLLEHRIPHVSSESLFHWLPQEYTVTKSYGFHNLDLFIDEKQHYLVDMFLSAIFTGQKDPSSEQIIQSILREEFQEDWMTGDWIDRIIWWNSDTKLDPRLANVFFLE